MDERVTRFREEAVDCPPPPSEDHGRGGGLVRAAAAGVASSSEEIFLFLVGIVEVETWGIWVDRRDNIIIWGKLISPGGSRHNHRAEGGTLPAIDQAKPEPKGRKNCIC